MDRFQNHNTGNKFVSLIIGQHLYEIVFICFCAYLHQNKHVIEGINIRKHLANIIIIQIGVVIFQNFYKDVEIIQKIGILLTFVELLQTIYDIQIGKQFLVGKDIIDKLNNSMGGNSLNNNNMSLNSSLDNQQLF